MIKVTGSIQTKNGMLYALLNYKDENGKRKVKWISAGKLKVVKLNSNVSIVPKQWLLEFMLTDDFIYNYPKDSKLKPILNQAIR